MRLNSQRTESWRWALGAVVSLHLLTTAGTWWITDHGEILAVANRFLDCGELNLRDLPPTYADIANMAAARHNFETRFLPGSILSLVPFVLLDRAAGWRDQSDFHFVHLQGHVFVGAALLLAGLAVRRMSGSDRLATFSILLAGLNWPVWMIARRLGPEPVLMFIVTLFIWSSSIAVRGACVFLLPWIHASGSLLAVGLLLLCVIEKTKIRTVAVLAIAFTAGLLSLTLLWNLPHGHLVYGGYGAYASDRFFVLRNPVSGIGLQLGTVAVLTPSLWIIAAMRARARFAACLAIALPALIAFGVFSDHEVARRFSPFVAAWAILLLSNGGRLSSPLAIGLAGLALAGGVAGLGMDYVASIPTPWGVFSGPHLMLLSLAFERGHAVLAGALALGLALVAAKGARRSLDILQDAEAAS